MKIFLSKQVEKFINLLDATSLDRVYRSINLLERYENNLCMPISKPLGRGLFEIRINGNLPIRIIYCFKNSHGYLLIAFIKKQNKIKNKYINMAEKIKKTLN